MSVSMSLREAHEIADRIRGDLGYGGIGDAAVALSGRVKELEAELKQEIIAYRDSVAENAKLLGDRTQELNAMKAQRDELLKVSIKFYVWWWHSYPKIREVPILIHRAISGVVEKITGKTGNEINLIDLPDSSDLREWNDKNITLEENPKEW